MQLFVVPRSIPIVLAMLVSLLRAQCVSQSENLSRSSIRSRSAEDADQHPAGDDERGAAEEARADELVPAEQERREPDAPERLGRDERRDDRDAAAVVGLEEADVGEPEEDARRATNARKPPSREPAARDEQPGGDGQPAARRASPPRRAPARRRCRARGGGRGCRGRRRRPSPRARRRARSTSRARAGPSRRRAGSRRPRSAARRRSRPPSRARRAAAARSRPRRAAPSRPSPTSATGRHRAPRA